jgi:hypothetical protein
MEARVKRLHPDAERLLDALRVADEPHVRDRDRIRSRVLERAGAAVGAAAATTIAARAAAQSAAPVSAGAGLVKIGLVTLVSVCAAGGAWWTVGRSGTAEAPSSNASARPSATSPARATSPVVTSNASAAAEHPDDGPVLPRASAPVVASSATAEDLESETSLLQRAQRALAGGDPKEALAVLAEHARRFPRGALAVERAGVQAIAACRAGQSRGRLDAERFLARYPTSPMAHRVRSACDVPEP